MHHEIEIQRIDEARDAQQIGAVHRGIGHAVAAGHGDGHILAEDRRDGDRNAADVNNFHIQAVFLVEAALLGDVPNRIGRADRGVGSFELVLGLGMSVIRCGEAN